MKSNQVKQFGRLRTFRMRVLNANYTIAPVNNWDRTVCASDIKKFLECEALYLQWKEGDATGVQSLTEQVGDIVHEETAKPEAQRLNDLASRITTVTDKVERERVVAEVKKMIEVSTAAQKADSKGATVSKKEETMVYFDNYTNTWWYAKLDSTDLTSNDRGTYLNVIDQKAGRYRSAMQLTSVFFQAYVAKMSKAFGHEGPIRYAVRYLRDRWGNILNTPEEKPYWLGRRLNESQDQALYGTQVTIQKMDKAWATGEFRAESGNRCKTCQFAKSCPAGLKWQAEQDALAEESMAEVAAKLVQVNTAEVAANDTIAAPAALVHAHASNGTQSGTMHAA